MRLSIEVCEAVIDQASDNTASLRRLSLTCSKFLPRARCHLFTNVVILTMQQMESTCDFLDGRPWLLRLVRKVTLSIPFRKDDSIYLSKHTADLLYCVSVHLLIRFPNLREWKIGPATLHSRLLLHDSILLCYQGYGSCIGNLELCGVRFDGMSDFIGLVSAFTNIHTLACSQISFANSSQNTPAGTTSFSRLPLISTLRVDTSVNIEAIVYLLDYGGAMLRNIKLVINEHHSRYFEWLENSMALLSQLSSLTLVVAIFDKDLPEVLHSCTRIIGAVEGTHLKDVQVEFKADPIVELGRRFSHPGPSMDACMALEEALLVIPNPGILVHHAIHTQRPERAQFWCRAVKGAFPRLNIALAPTATKPDLDQRGHELEVTSLVVSHNSEKMITASADGTIIIWDLSRGTVLQEWSACGEKVEALALSPDSRRLVSAGGHTLVVWAMDNYVRKVAELEGHAGTVVIGCACSPDGMLMASASTDGTILIWDASSFELRSLLLDPEGSPPNQLQFAPDSWHLAWISGDHDCCICIPLVDLGPTRLRSLPDRRGADTLAFSFDPEGRRIATAHGYANYDTEACVIRIWDVVTGDALAVLSGHSQPVTSISFSLDGRFLLSTSEYDGSARVWDADSGEQTGSLNTGGISSACFSPDGKYVACGKRRGWVQLYRTQDLRGRHSVPKYVDKTATHWVTHIAFSPNGSFLIYEDCAGTVRIEH